MIEYKEHDGKLFRMLEKPVPLKEKNTNVLVRFITHGVIGEYVMEHWLDCNQPNVPIYIDDVDSDGDVMVWFDENRNEHHCCPFPMFEIIGTLVKEGSHWWALYQMMQGEKVFRVEWECDMYCQYTNNEIITFRYGISSTINPVKEWIANAKRADSGWQIYTEPESKYKAGDWVEHKESKEQATISRIMSYGAIEIEFAYSTESDIYQANDFHNDFRKLSPSEVVIRIGCLSGTIRYCLSFDHDGAKHDAIKMFNGDGKCIAIIHLEALDTGTRELVEGLLNAQKEEEDEKR